jgi:uncharacterized protein (TIGR00369 family)
MSGKYLDKFSEVPVNKFFRYTWISRSPDGAEISMEARPEYAQETGVVQGGILSAIADTAAVYAFLPDIEDYRQMTGIEFKMNFLRPAKPDEGPIAARSKILRRGRTIGVCEVELTQGGKLTAKGTFTYMFLNTSDADRTGKE